MRLLRIVATFIIVTIAWVFFRMPSLPEAIDYIGHFFSGFGTPSMMKDKTFAIILMAIAIVAFKETREEFFPKALHFLDNRYVKWAECVVVFCLILLCGALDSGSFIYGIF